MEKENKTRIVSGFFMAIAVVYSLFFWFSAVNIMQALAYEEWFRPLLFFSIIFIGWSLGAILSGDNFWIKISSALIILTGAYFSLNWKYLLIVAFSSLLIWVANSQINREIGIRTELSIWNSLRIGRRFFIIAIALVLASQYYFGHSQGEEDKKDFNIKIGQEHAWIATRIMSAIDPELTTEEMENLTIDEFILRKTDSALSEKIRQEETIIDENNIPNGLLENLTGGINIEQIEKDIILQENRRNIEGIVKKEVKGDEKMIDVVSDVINSRANEILNAELNDGNTTPMISIILSIILFLAIVSLGTFISPVLIFLVWVLFKILIWFRLVTIEKRESFVEVII